MTVMMHQATYEMPGAPTFRPRPPSGAEAFAAHLAPVGELILHQGTGSIEQILRVVREELGFELAYLAEFTNGNQVFRDVEGEGASFDIAGGDSLPLEETYCRRMVAGTLPNIIRDAQTDPRVNDMAGTHQSNIGAYIGVPVVMPDGRLYGSLCALSHMPHQSLNHQDTKFLQVLSHIIAGQLQRDELQDTNRQLGLQAAGVAALVRALEARDGYTGTHSQAVVALAVAVGRRLGLSADEMATVEQTARLHDVGKIAVSDAILNKPGPLTETEWQMMRQHPINGAEIVSSIESLAHLAPAIRAEHERWDGQGYPDRLAGSEIPVASRIGFACDAYHAMVSDRPYRASMGHTAAIQELERNAGTQFCPETIRTLVEVLAGPA